MYNIISSSCSNNTVVLYLTIFLCGCGNATESKVVSHYSDVSRDAATVCFDRFLIDIPAQPQIGASATRRFNDGYAFPGIHSNGTGVPRWGQIEITETHPSNLTGFAMILKGVSEYYGLTGRQAINLPEVDEEISDLEYRLKRILIEEDSVRLDDLKGRLADLQWLKYSTSRRGEIKDPNGRYAFRNGTRFHVGYFDTADQRIRSFSGRTKRFTITEPGVASDELERVRHVYQTRAPTNIPSIPGYCTGFGFFREPVAPERDTSFQSPFRSSWYPNLIFTVKIEPAWSDGSRGAPPKSGYLPYLMNMVGLRVSEIHGPVETEIGGSPGIIHGMKYNPDCGRNKCTPLEQAYEFVALTYGEPGRIDRPRIELKMVAALSDDYRAKSTVAPGGKHWNKEYKPGLRGLTPPPYEVGRALFESVVKSLRRRPGAIAPGAVVSGSLGPPAPPGD